ncbi:Card1-like endonuclease domain-containing protein [Hydrogenimonas sp.]
MRMILLPPEDLTQTLGALYTFRHKIRELILLGGHRGEEKKRIDRYANKLRRYAKRERLHWQEIKSLPFKECDPASYVRLRERYASDDTPVTILAADATASTILAASKAFADIAAILTYDAYDNRLSLFENDSLRHFEADPMDLNTYCSMLGYTIETSREKADFSEEEQDAVRYLFSREQEFSRIRMKLMHEKSITEDDSGIVQALKRLKIIRDGRIVDQYAKNRLAGSLFEEYIFGLCQEMGFDEVRMGCRIDFSFKEKLRQPVKNEFDILFIEKNRIGTVECKYTQSSFNARKFLYQYDTVMDYFGRTARAILLNLNKEENPDSRTKEYMHTVLSRSRFGNVRILATSRFDESRFKNLLRWAGEEGVNLY